MPSESALSSANAEDVRRGFGAAADEALTPGRSRPTAARIRLVQFISFTVGDDHYGIDIMAVLEIRGWSQITPLPGQPPYVRGVLNLRGAIVPIIDLRCRFGQGVTQATPMHIVIVVKVADHLAGLLADRVSDIISVDPAKIQPVPKDAQGAPTSFLCGIAVMGAAMITLIDLRNLLALDDALRATCSCGTSSIAGAE